MTAFAYYRLPCEQHATYVAQHVGEPEILSSVAQLNGKEGFVIAPFQPSAECPVVLIHPDEKRVILLTGENFEGDLGEKNSDGGQNGGLKDENGGLKGNGKSEEKDGYVRDFGCFHGQLQKGEFRKIVLARKSVQTTRLSAEALFAKACRMYPRLFVALVCSEASGMWLMATPEVLLNGRAGEYHTMSLAGTQKAPMTSVCPIPHEATEGLEWPQKDQEEQQYVTDYIEACIRTFSDDYRLQGPYTMTAAHLCHLRTDIHFRLPCADVLGDVLYCTKYNAGVIEEGGGLKMDELTHDFSASAPGFWLHAVQNEAGEETGECSQAVYGSENKFYADTFTFNAETGVITCKIGQYPGAVKDNEQWWVSVYLLRGDKAYRLKYTLKINEREHGSGVEGMNKVGEDVINAEISPDSINYTHVFIYPDINAIAAALGCEVGTFTMQALDETYNWGGSTASYGGFWFDKNGYVVSWENAACFYIEPTAANNYSILKVGQKPGSLSVGDKYSTKLYFVNENNYYQVSVNLTIIEREPGPSVDKMNKVGEDYINVDLEAASDYTSVKFSVDIEAIASALGVDVQYISMQALDENNNWANPTNNNDGFWFDMNGFVTSWGNTAYFYITPAEGYSLLDLGQYPNRLSAGATYSTKLYFVNGNNYYELIVILNVSGSNDDGRINGLYYNLISKAKIAEVINGSVMYSGNIVIPQTVEYEGIIYNVTSIGESAFRGSKISSVVMPNSIETIKSYAFQNCTNLSSVTIPNSVTSIGQSAFSGCI